MYFAIVSLQYINEVATNVQFHISGHLHNIMLTFVYYFHEVVEYSNAKHIAQ
jgi:hypothetical protein